MANLLCPYCSAPIAEDDHSIEHVFVSALEGRATISAGRRCNNKIGDEIEGVLQKPGTIFNVAKQAKGFGRPMKGTIGDDAEGVMLDLVAQEIRSLRPVVTEEVDGQAIRRITGSISQAERILRKDMKLAPDQVAELMATARVVDFGDSMVNMTVSHDISLGARLEAKVALAAGTLVGGDEFIVSPVADALRRVLHGEPPPAGCDNKILIVFDETFASDLPYPVTKLAPGQDESQAVFISLGGGRTAAVVHLMGINPGLAGIVVDAPMPFGDGIPVLVRDAAGGVLVRPLIDDIVAAVNEVGIDFGDGLER